MSDCAVTRIDDRLQVAGDMNIYTAAVIKEQLVALAPCLGEDVEIDLSGVTGLDTAGVQIMLMLRRLAHSRGVPFRLVSPSAVAVEVLELCGLQSLVTEHAS
ncbi:MAG: STAS domain-containing protein [Steroidobacter sp.]